MVTAKPSLMKLLGNLAKGTPGTGMRDDVPAMIDGQQPAALSEGEYVIPADIVSLIGDGNTEAGIKVLDGMVETIRHKKTGTKKQPDEMANLFAGGKIKGAKC